MDILGKRFDGKGSLYMDNLDYDCIQLLLKARLSIGVPESNKYLFAIRSGRDNLERYINMYDVMRRFSEKCSNEYVSIDHTKIRSTALRKHAATVNGIIDDGKNTPMCKDILGHSKQMHKNKYKRIVDRQDVEKVNFLKRINSSHYSSDQSNQNKKKFKLNESRLQNLANFNTEEEETTSECTPETTPESNQTKGKQKMKKQIPKPQNLILQNLENSDPKDEKTASESKSEIFSLYFYVIIFLKTYVV